MDAFLKNLHFQALGDSLARLPELMRSIPDIARNPAANPLQAAIVLGIFVILVLIVLLTFVLILVRPAAELVPVRGMGAGPRADSQGRERKKLSVAERAIGGTTVGSVVCIVLAVVWVVSGATTASSAACTSCHTTSVHSTAPLTDPHRSVECVDCHEPGGGLARLTSNLPIRAAHFYYGQSNPKKAATYGRTISSIGCKECHGYNLGVIGIDVARGLRISHKEPLAAGAECVDCHALQNGQVLARTVGMQTCLRCHDDKQAKAACSVCHTADPAQAIVARDSGSPLASRLVPSPPCGACHFDMTRCDNCHGLRMPHTQVFMAYGHAREGALNIWNNGGQLCGKCHYAGRRACNQDGCHTYKFPQHALSWKVDHQKALWSQADSICGCHGWYSRQHQGVIFCQICHPTKPPGTQP